LNIIWPPFGNVVKKAITVLPFTMVAVGEARTVPIAAEMETAPWSVGLSDGTGKSFGIVIATPMPFGAPVPPDMLIPV